MHNIESSNTPVISDTLPTPGDETQAMAELKLSSLQDVFSDHQDPDRAAYTLLKELEKYPEVAMIDFIKSAVLANYASKEVPLPEVKRMLTLAIDSGRPADSNALCMIGSIHEVDEDTACAVFAEYSITSNGSWSDKGSDKIYTTAAHLLALPPACVSHKKRQAYL